MFFTQAGQRGALVHLAKEMALRERIETQRRQYKAHRKAQARLQAQWELHEEVHNSGQGWIENHRFREIVTVPQMP